MMKKNGFTLAEVLISIAIVGIAAALTLPTLSLNVEKRKIGPALMKAVNTVESASTLALQMNDARKLSEIKINGTQVSNLLSDLLPHYTKLVKIPYDGYMSFSEGYAAKDGVVLLNGGFIEDTSPNFFAIVVDTNGSRGPNTDGKDVFTLYVLQDGIVAPYGSYLAKEKGLFDDDWTTQCPLKENGNPNLGSVASCAGHIVDNGGRILYNYEGIPND